MGKREVSSLPFPDHGSRRRPLRTLLNRTAKLRSSEERGNKRYAPTPLNHPPRIPLPPHHLQRLPHPLPAILHAARQHPHRRMIRFENGCRGAEAVSFTALEVGELEGEGGFEGDTERTG